MTMKQLTADERALMTHISNWGSDGYPLIHAGKTWSWNYRDRIRSHETFRTKKAAVASFEAFHRSLIDAYAFENVHAGFRQWLEDVAAVNVLSAWGVFLLWRKYSRDCQSADQSPVQFEFLQWHKLKDPERPESHHARCASHLDDACDCVNLWLGDAVVKKALEVSK